MSDCLKDINHGTAFEKLSASEKNILNENKTRLNYKKQEVILKQGTIASNILYGISGLFKLHIEGTKKDVILTLKKDNVFLGLTSLYYLDKTYIYSVTALEDCVVDIYDKHDFKEVLNSNVEFSNEILKYVNHNSAKIFRRYLCVTDKNARGKIADMILCMVNDIYESLHFTIALSRQEIADFVGLSMENTIRILKEFEADKIIKLKGRSFEILDKETLNKISDFG